jgi:hypothetical protein
MLEIKYCKNMRFTAHFLKRKIHIKWEASLFIL